MIHADVSIAPLDRHTAAYCAEEAVVTTHTKSCDLKRLPTEAIIDVIAFDVTRLLDAFGLPGTTS